VIPFSLLAFPFSLCCAEAVAQEEAAAAQRERHALATDAATERAARAACEDEFHALMDTKIKLDAEIARYRAVLEEEEAAAARPTATARSVGARTPAPTTTTTSAMAAAESPATRPLAFRFDGSGVPAHYHPSALPPSQVSGGGGYGNAGGYGHAGGEYYSYVPVDARAPPPPPPMHGYGYYGGGGGY
jgi:hypothetical protein